MKVFMLGWEFPPRMTGGLGTACQGLVKSLVRRGVDVHFLVPGGGREGVAEEEGDAAQDPIRKEAARGRGGFVMTSVPVRLDPYGGGETAREEKNGLFSSGEAREDLYRGDLLGAVDRLAGEAARTAARLGCDVIHAHDWMTFPAGLAARKAAGRPLIAHLHSTEYDRCLDRVWPPVCRIEREGLNSADRVVAVSARSKWQIVEKYGVVPEKITVIHNGLNRDHIENAPAANPDFLPGKSPSGIVLFLGRITPQKGPHFFIEAAAKILETEKDALFLVAGSGDMVPALVERTAALGISSRVLFTGFLDGGMVRAAFELADVYVMPSVSDPFGISCLEAMYLETPVVLSNQAGISEVVENVRKVDYWDIDRIAREVVRLLRDPPFARETAARAAAEARGITWDHPASRCIALYREALAERGLAPGGR